MILWNGSPLQTTYVSPTVLQVQVPASLIASVGSASIKVSTADGAQTFASASSSTFTIAAPAPIGLSAIGPTRVTAGERDFVLTARGTNFRTGAKVLWNGAPRATTWISDTEVAAQIPATEVASMGTATVAVQNYPSADTSAALPVSIVARNIDATALQINSRHNGAIEFNNVSLPASAKWIAQLARQPSYALIAEGKVFVTTTMGTSHMANSSSEITALSQATGATIWGPVVLAGAAGIAYDDGKLFVVTASPSLSGTIQALDPATGNKIWSSELPGQWVFSSPPTARDGMVFISAAGSAGTIYGVAEQDGKIAWTQRVSNGDASSPMVSVDSVAVSYPCQTYVFRPLTGTPVWSRNDGCDGGGGGTPVEANGLLYAPSGTSTYDGARLNIASGEPLGGYVADNPPAIGAQTGYFLQSGSLRAVNLSSNAVLWSFAGDGTLVTSPLLVNQYVFVGSSNGNLYAIDSATGQSVWSQHLQFPIPAGATWNSILPLSGLAAGDGLLLVPAGATLSAYELSANP